MNKFINRVLGVAMSMTIAISCAAASPKQYGLKVIKSYPHDRDSYTQGLFFSPEGSLYESTGHYGKSKMMQVDLATGEPIRKVSFNKKFFGEGSTILDGKIYILTWENHLVFVYDAETLKYEKTLSWPYEGWGLTTDGKNLIVSTGSSTIYFVDPSTFKVVRTINVKSNGRPLRLLNELEWIDGRIWANVYTSNLIIIINPSDGSIEGVIDCAGLLPENLKDDSTDVLNGIARNPVDGRIYLTGKNWPLLYEVQLIKK